ncbi:MAG: hypothetical protein QW041_03320 [Candidatus Pacearchaeota archaeon]
MENDVEIEKAKYVLLIKKLYSNKEGINILTNIVEKAIAYTNKVVLNEDCFKEELELEKELGKYSEFNNINTHLFASTLIDYLYNNRKK